MKFIFKAILGGLVLLTTVLVLGLSIGAYLAYGKYEQPGPLDRAALVTIPRGSSVYSISKILLDNGVLDPSSVSPVNIFVHASKITKQANKLKAGEYEFTPHMSMKDILNKLEKGEVFSRQVTIREGLTNYEIKRILLQQNDLETEGAQKHPEGRLLPETYSYARGDSNADILTRMASAMDKALDEAEKNGWTVVDMKADWKTIYPGF